MKPTTAHPRLTTRRVDGFNEFETKLMRFAEEGSDGIIWLVTGKLHSNYFLAAYYLQRLGYLWPTQKGKPRGTDGEFVSGSFGWKLQDEGRAALAILNAKIAA